MVLECGFESQLHLKMAEKVAKNKGSQMGQAKAKNSNFFK